MKLDYSTVLVLAPHTDDGELGCGGTIARFVEEGKQVYYVAFSTARRSIPPDLPQNITEVEVRKATNILGIPSENLLIFDIPVRDFPMYRQTVLQHMIDLRQQLQPDLILVPSLHDIHQDHQVVAAEGLRAFKSHTILGYEEPWNNIVFETRCFIPLEERHIAKKIEALHCYKSQEYRAYLDDEFIRGLGRTRGTQIEGGYAEAFEVIRWIVR